MSKEFVESFFPEVAKLLKKHTQTAPLFASFFPDAVADLCPEVVVVVIGAGDSAISVRNPILSLHAVLGAGIGLYGGTLFWRGPTQQHKLWSLAFATYGLMNLVALPLHCFVDAPSAPYNHPVLWVLDTYLTGVSSSALLTVCRHELVRRWNSRTEKNRSSSDRSLQVEWMLWNIVGFACVGAFLGLGLTLPLELWYLFPTVSVSYVVTPMLVGDALYRQQRRRQRQARIVSASRVALLGCTLSTTLLLGGIYFDAQLCLMLDGTRIWDLLMAGSQTFAACNLLFASLLWYLRQVLTTRTTDEYHSEQKEA